MFAYDVFAVFGAGGVGGDVVVVSAVEDPASAVAVDGEGASSFDEGEGFAEWTEGVGVAGDFEGADVFVEACEHELVAGAGADACSSG